MPFNRAPTPDSTASLSFLRYSFYEVQCGDIDSNIGLLFVHSGFAAPEAVFRRFSVQREVSQRPRVKGLPARIRWKFIAGKIIELHGSTCWIVHCHVWSPANPIEKHGTGSFNKGHIIGFDSLIWGGWQYSVLVRTSIQDSFESGSYRITIYSAWDFRNGAAWSINIRGKPGCITYLDFVWCLFDVHPENPGQTSSRRWNADMDAGRSLHMAIRTYLKL